MPTYHTKNHIPSSSLSWKDALLKVCHRRSMMCSSVSRCCCPLPVTSTLRLSSTPLRGPHSSGINMWHPYQLQRQCKDRWGRNTNIQRSLHFHPKSHSQFIIININSRMIQCWINQAQHKALLIASLAFYPVQELTVRSTSQNGHHVSTRVLQDLASDKRQERADK